MTEWQCASCGERAPHTSPGGNMPNCPNCGTFAWRTPVIEGLGESCPSPGCPRQLSYGPQSESLRCPIHGPMRNVPLGGRAGNVATR